MNKLGQAQATPLRIAALCLTIAACVFGFAESALACKCVEPELGRSYAQADQVVHVRVERVTHSTRSHVYYSALLLEDAYKGCLQANTRIRIRTARDSAACGASFDSGGEYLLFGQRVRGLGRVATLETSSCAGNDAWGDLSDEDVAFLQSRYNCCGDECACTGGDEPVGCSADACAGSSCEVGGASCVPNPCNGCNAEWFDPSGARVCNAPVLPPAPTCALYSLSPADAVVTWGAKNFADRSAAQQWCEQASASSCELFEGDCASNAIACNDPYQPVCTVFATPDSFGKRRSVTVPNDCNVRSALMREAGSASSAAATIVSATSCGNPCAADIECGAAQECTNAGDVCNPPPGFCREGTTCPDACMGVCRFPL